ncbi:hypothetical protein V6N12_064630 [Hibiscus sabdariffa]|uniref:Reverse transcriptase zinc-binding domain-containing protein n=1 Tax=Hibiscus sabdariffa TaxID=183260 RepID=A0ABR2G6B5_9ROSI
MDPSCLRCSQSPEDNIHVIRDCPFAMQPLPFGEPQSLAFFSAGKQDFGDDFNPPLCFLSYEEYLLFAYI